MEVIQSVKIYCLSLSANSGRFHCIGLHFQGEYYNLGTGEKREVVVTFGIRNCRLKTPALMRLPMFNTINC